MKKPIPTAEPTQVGAADSTNSFLELIRGTLRREAEKMLAEEVTTLCGRSHYPQLEALYRRAGSGSRGMSRRWPAGAPATAARAAARRGPQALSPSPLPSSGDTLSKEGLQKTYPVANSYSEDAPNNLPNLSWRVSCFGREGFRSGRSLRMAMHRLSVDRIEVFVVAGLAESRRLADVRNWSG